MLVLETTVWPGNAGQWLAILGLGLGPVGIAFYAWDYGVKNGDIQVLGVSSYTAPLFSTLILIVFGYGEASIAIAAACLLITGGRVPRRLRHAAREEKPVSGLISEPGVPVLTLGFLSLAGFAVYLAMLQRSASWMRTGAKTLAVGALAVLASQTGGPCTAGCAHLALSALGDAFLAHEGDAAFLGGLGSFLVAHIALCGAVGRFGWLRVHRCKSVPGLLAMVAGFAFVGMVSLMVRKAGAAGGAGGNLCDGDKPQWELGGVTFGGLALAGSHVCSWLQMQFWESEKFLMPETSPAAAADQRLRFGFCITRGRC
jgi:hypothetical protein